MQMDAPPESPAAVLVGEEGEGVAEYAMAEAARLDALALLAAAGLRVELSLTLCDEAFIRALNTQWRDKERSTDVLSFPMDDERMVGDLVVCLPVAAAQAAERGHSLRTEVRVLLVHGLLHLCGYDHEEGASAASEQADAERRLLTRLGWAEEGLVGASLDD